MLLVAVLLATVPLAASDWVSTVRSCVARKDFACAKTFVEQELQRDPTNLEARAWRGRILAWTGNWPAAEEEYRAVLQKQPNDGEILLALSDVQLWQEEFADALHTLQQADASNAEVSEVLRRRARAFTGLRRPNEATATYRALFRTHPADPEARNALLNPESTRHLLRVGSDTDTFDFTGPANSESIALVSRWNERWTTHVGGTFYQRFGERAGKANLGATYKFSTHDWVTVDGAMGNHQNVASEGEANFEYGHGFTGKLGPILGIESYVQQRNLWYSASHVTTIGTSQLLYLPRECTWTVSVTGVRSSFGARGEWTVSGFTRLGVPVAKRVTINGFYAVGAENFSKVDEIGRFSAHTFGGGVRVQLNSRQDIAGYVALQNRTQNRTQTTVGVSYGVRF